MNNTISELRSSLRTAIKTEEALRAQLRDSELNLENEKENVSIVTESRNKYEHELQEARSQISDAQGQLNVGQNDTIRFESRKNQAELEIIDLNNQIHGLRSDKASLESDNCSLRKELGAEQQLNTQAQNDVTRMKSLVSNFESTKNELVSRLQTVNKEKTTEEKDRVGLVDEIKHLKKLILEKDQEIEDQRRSIIDLDQRYDSLCNQLDVKTEELNKTQRCLEAQNQEFSHTRQHISLISNKEEGYAKRLAEREGEVSELKH